MNLFDPVVADTNRYYAERDAQDRYENALRDDPIWEYLSPEDQNSFGYRAMSVAQAGIEDECDAGRRLVALLREFAPRAFLAMKEEAEEERGDR